MEGETDYLPVFGGTPIFDRRPVRFHYLRSIPETEDDIIELYITSEMKRPESSTRPL